MSERADTTELEGALRVGCALFNAGAYHAAHDAWEPLWLPLEADTPDERFLHGLIQYTAAVHHATEGNAVGATGLAERAHQYVTALPGWWHGIDLVSIRHMLRALAADTTIVTRRDPPPLTHEGVAIQIEQLTATELSSAVDAVYESDPRWEREILEAAMAAARESEPGAQIVRLLCVFIRDRAYRATVFDRIERYVDRRSQHTKDLHGLFGTNEDKTETEDRT